MTDPTPPDSGRASSPANEPPTPGRFVEVDPDLSGPPARPLEVHLLVGLTAVASLVTLFWGASVMIGGGMLCCFCMAPVATFQLILGVVGLVYAGRQLSPYPPPLPVGLSVAFIATIIGCDMVSPLLGIVMLVLSQTDGARVYYARCALAKMAAGAGEQGGAE